MPKIEGYFEYDDGLTPGRSKDGSIHHNLYDRGRLAGHGRFIPNEEPPPSEDYADEGEATGDDESDPMAELIAYAGLFGGIAAWKLSKPHLQEYWDNRGREGVRSAREKIFGSRGSLPASEVADSHSKAQTSPAGTSQKPVAAVKEEGEFILSISQAQALLAAALNARNLSEAAMNILRRARIVDTSGVLIPSKELTSAARRRIRHTVQQGLGTGPSQSNDVLTELRVKFEELSARRKRR